MNQINRTYCKTSIGEFVLGSFDGKLCLLDWKYRRMRTTIDKRIANGLKGEYVEKRDNVMDETIDQLDEYLNGNRYRFDIPLLTVGTEFQKNVWHALLKLPYGHTASYSQLATRINNETVVRAVASANGANAISIIIPCHRIIGSNGDLVGYAGGLPVKKRLLKLEQNDNESSEQEQHQLCWALEQGS